MNLDNIKKSMTFSLILLPVTVLMAFILIFRFSGYPDENSDGNKTVIAERVNLRAHKDIVIIAIDEETLRWFYSEGIQWPFPWEIHAKFTNFVAGGRPSAIFFDVLFETKNNDEINFARAMKNSGCTFLDYKFLTERADVQYADLARRLAVFSRFRFPAGREDQSEELFKDLILPNPVLAEQSKGIGFANIIPDGDGINRKMPLIVRFKGSYYPGIDLMLVMNYYGISLEDVDVRNGKYIRLKNLPIKKMARPNSGRYIDIPVDSSGSMKVNYIGGQGSFARYPYYLFCREGSMEGNNALNGKLCLVGATTGADLYKTPAYGGMDSIEHHASAINTIISQDFVNSR